MNHKSTAPNDTTQQFPDGISHNDYNIEFVCCKKTKTVIWLEKGKINTFNNLPPNVYQALEELFLTDDEAVKWSVNFYPEHAHDLKRLVEIYTYYMYGQTDHIPDVAERPLESCKNLRNPKECTSLNVIHKPINTVHLSQRDLQILDDFAKGLAHKIIVFRLGISLSTLNFHKHNLYKLIGATNNTGAV